MKFGITIPLHRGVDAQVNIELAKRAEKLGFNSIWISDHVILPRKYKHRFSDILYDPFVILAYIAASTNKLQLGTSVLILPYRNPVVVAKMIATLDMLSGGRIIFGVGPGWMSEEFDTLGIPFKERGKRTDEYIRIFKELWIKEEHNFNGNFHKFSAIKFYPKPLQRPHPPIWVGGNSRTAISRALEHGNGWHPVWFSPSEMQEKLRYFKNTAKDQGRELGNFVFSIRNRLSILKSGEKETKHLERVRGKNIFAFYGTREEIIEYIREFEKIGVSHIVFDLDVDNNEDMFHMIEEFSKDIMPLFKG